jgi:hypothetical protein
VAVLCELLDRQAQDVLRNNGGRVLLALPGFLAFLEREPRLAGLVEDLQSESKRHWQEYKDECRAVLSALRTIWASTTAVLDRVRAADAEDRCHWSGLGFDDFGERLAAEPEFEREYTTKQPEAVTRQHFALRHFVSCGYDQQTEAWRQPGLEDASAKLNHLGQRLDRAWKGRRLRLESEGGAAYIELRRRADALVPSMTDGEDGLLMAARNMNTKEIWARIEEHARFADAPHANSSPPDFANARRLVEVLLLALQTKLAEGRSRAAVVRRYVARCETFDRARLLEVHRRGKVS